MIEITKIIETETGHRLTGYNGKCAHLHGHRYRWEVSVTAPMLDSTGFVIDYGDLKEILKKTVDNFDHAFIIHDEDPLYRAIGLEGLKATNGDAGRIILVSFNPTSENIIELAGEMIKPLLPDGISLVKIKLWETSGSFCERHFPQF